MINAEEFDQLMARVCDGRASAADFQKLEGLLRNDPAALDAYIRYTDLHASLEVGDWQTPANVVAFQKDVPAEKVSRWKSWWSGWAATAAAVLLLGTVAALWLRPSAAPASSGYAYASLSSSVGAHWKNPNLEEALRRGELPSGTLRLDSGVAEFTFASGATLMVEGPAEFEPLGPKRVFVHSGKVFCRCPDEPSRMTIVTSETEVTDLGTEFTVEANPNKMTRVGVISGEVQLVKADKMLHLKAGQSVEISLDRVARISPFRADLLPPAFRLDAAALEAAENRNLLKNPGFEADFSKTGRENEIKAGQWFSTFREAGWSRDRGREGSAALRMRSQGNNLDHFYPWVGQYVDVGNIAGQVVVASVWAMQPGRDPLRKRQCAILKLVFLDKENRQFACAERHFLHDDDPKERYVQARLAALAPAGTVRVLFQVMFQPMKFSTGSAFFDDAFLNVLPQNQLGIDE